MVPNPGPGGTPTLHILHIALIKHTSFKSWSFYKWADDLNLVCMIKETCKMCSVRVPPGPGLRTTVLECMSLQGLFLENRDILTSYTVGYTQTKSVFAPHFSWAELKDLRLFPCKQKAYLSQIYCSQICLNMCYRALLLCRDNLSTSQVWHIQMLIRQHECCRGVP